jgi:hypothetical protein
MGGFTTHKMKSGGHNGKVWETTEKKLSQSMKILRGMMMKIPEEKDGQRVFCIVLCVQPCEGGRVSFAGITVRILYVPCRPRGKALSPACGANGRW